MIIFGIQVGVCELCLTSFISHKSQCTCFHYLCNPFMQDWSLELEEVFSLEREGEFDKFAPYRDKLGNRMLLWHGRL